MTRDSRHISVTIERPAADVYTYAADPSNLPQWAAGLANSAVEFDDGEWVAESPMGRVRVSFARRNDFGVLDHTVTLPSGESVFNPLRVISYGDSCEVVFTVRRRPSMTEAEFDSDADAVSRDLASLKRRCEAH
ncbi:SRPBCC family protein [Spelaeicoccus albus]|uniref:Polyketide cyclase/dehydrase/lipid transport protein n=1 Tax=Spelaeicoccus albus TaxID=1280376 RepID=A0A7Z0A8T5_9MICO|nr:SRPBCC family protein [Spelaeicoccus albus]NYI66499.1 hypothetical protein [Spelaeicoccus albus]